VEFERTVAIVDLYFLTTIKCVQSACIVTEFADDFKIKFLSEYFSLFVFQIIVENINVLFSNCFRCFVFG
jgi:hypothetical protein